MARHKIRYEPADGHIAIAKCMAHHNAENRKFSAEMFAAIATVVAAPMEILFRTGRLQT